MITNVNSDRESVRTQARQLKRKAGAVMEDAGHMMGNLGQRALHRVQTLGQDGIEYVRGRPMKMLCGALAVGFCLGFLTRGRS
jgi:ElaB/YqjD/DUF883 family membrane-anchored ribosome-binding protein